MVAIIYYPRTKEHELRVHSKGQSCWRKILSSHDFPSIVETDGAFQFMSGTLNWLAVHMSGYGYDWDTHC